MASNGYANGSAAHDFELLQNRLSTLFAANGQAAAVAGGWAPAVSLQETPAGLTLTVELPGLTRDQVAIEIENDTLTIRGEKPDTPNEGRYHVRERAHGPFQRVFRVPRWVESDGISADMEHGVLEIRLPKARAAQPKRIEIGGDRKSA